MNHHKIAFDRWIKPLMWVLLVFANNAVQAQTAGDPNKFSTTPDHPACRFFDGYAYNSDGTVTDPRTGLVWKRCAEGTTWNGQSCSPNGTEMNWVEAMKAARASRFLGHSDWRLPTRTELQAVAGHYEQCKSNDWKKGQYAASSAIAHAADKDKSPGWFWSSSPDPGNNNFASGVSFRSGYLSGSYRHFRNNVRLVRVGAATGTGVAQEFEAEYAKLGQYQKLIDEQTARFKALKDAEEAQRNAQREAEEAQRKTQLARDAAVKSLLALGPQGLYLEAGKLQRSGGRSKINGEEFSSSQMYELLVNNFPKTGFAVMASDQLSAIAHVRTWCENERQRREAACNGSRDPAACLSQLREILRCP
jgi:Protein of unknown function (DUF1566)